MTKPLSMKTMKESVRSSKKQAKRPKSFPVSSSTSQNWARHACETPPKALLPIVESPDHHFSSLRFLVTNQTSGTTDGSVKRAQIKVLPDDVILSWLTF